MSWERQKMCVHISVSVAQNFYLSTFALLRKRLHIEKYYPFPRYKIKLTNGSEMVLNTLNFTLTVTLFAYPFKTDVGYSVWLTVDGK